MAALASFGRASGVQGGVLTADQAIALLEDRRAGEGVLLPYGNGRSYGDTCLNRAGSVIDMRGRAAILGFDAANGVLEAEAGALLSDIIDFAGPRGWFPAVVPGTKFVTLGGAIANDIHGKNHHRRGTFGAHVESIELLRSDGRRYRCSRTENAALFAATIGGMGLTGLILAASIRLMRAPSLAVDQAITPFASLDAYFDLAPQADATNEYAVAWVDQLASGRRAGRGLLITGNHTEGGATAAGRSLLGVPFQPPVNVLNRPVLRLFNEAYYRAKARKAGASRIGPDGFFFPLDGLANWNRLYGPAGLFQHQSVIPEAAARQAIPSMLEASRAAGQGSFLTVLKRFGAVASPGLLSFPRPGYTLTLDFPNRGQATLDLLARLDAITIDAGGAVNPYKDARMSPAIFAASFPGWPVLEGVRDKAFVSDFWRRTALRLAGAVGHARVLAAE